MKVFFLDIDGVLNNRPHMKTVWQGHKLPDYTPYMMPEKVRLLNRVFEKLPELKCVIHSNWGRMMPEEQIKQALLNNGFAHWDRYLGLTPKKMSSTKNNEIKWWLDESDEEEHGVDQYVVVDDDHMDMHFIGQFHPKKQKMWVQTSFENGLQPKHIRKILLFFGVDENVPAAENEEV